MAETESSMPTRNVTAGVAKWCNHHFIGLGFKYVFIIS